MYVTPLNVPTRSGALISADRVTLGIIPKMWEVPRGLRFTYEVFLWKKNSKSNYGLFSIDRTVCNHRCKSLIFNQQLSAALRY